MSDRRGHFPERSLTLLPGGAAPIVIMMIMVIMILLLLMIIIMILILILIVIVLVAVATSAYPTRAPRRAPGSISVRRR